MVARSFLGMSRNFKTNLFTLLSLFRRLSRSEGLIEKKAVSEPEIIADPTTKTMSANREIPVSNEKPPEAVSKKINSKLGKGSGSIVSKTELLVYTSKYVTKLVRKIIQ